MKCDDCEREACFFFTFTNKHCAALYSLCMLHGKNLATRVPADRNKKYWAELTSEEAIIFEVMHS
jgi:hypothetical protein